MDKKRTKHSCYKKNLDMFFESKANLFILSFTFALFLLFWNLILKQSFQWSQVSIFSKPEDYIFYSRLTFVTIGAILYRLGFFKWLRSISPSGKDFQLAKGVIWISLIALVVYIVSLIVDTLNFISSVFYNAGIYVLYLLPILGSSVFVMLVFLLMKCLCKK